jgi:hypothetical protein
MDLELGGTVTRALKVADGTELGSLHVGTDGTDPVLSFTEIACRRGDTGIYRIPIA